MNDIAIRVQNLSKQYSIHALKSRRDNLGERITNGFKQAFRLNGHVAADDYIWALKDICFEIKRGESVGIIGPNGAGKSTLLKILSRITIPTSGFAEIHGRVGSLLEVGTGFHPELSGRENIYLNGSILGMRKAEIDRRFDEIVDFSGVEKFIDTPVKRYSSGMYVRLAFAVTVHMESEILIVDEVLAVGDIDFQQKCLAKMKNAVRTGRTILFVSHNMTAVKALCPRVILLEEGSVGEIGQTQTVVSSYLHTIGGDDRTLERTWTDRKTAPGNDEVRLRHVHIISDSSDGSDTIQTDKSIQIEIEYWNLVPGIPLVVEISLYTDDGFAVFETLTSDGPDWHGQPLPTGLLRSVCHIPGNFLNEGDYTIRLFFLDNGARVIYDHDRALSFTVYETRVRKVPWYGRYGGVVRPMLDWNTELIMPTTDATCSVINIEDPG